jgi:ankyrin repeat protein
MLKDCSACMQQLPEGGFSEKQWRGKRNRRCSNCIVLGKEVGVESCASQAQHSDCQASMPQCSADHLTHCAREGRNKCARCKQMVYCSVDCQKAHWKDSHKRECGVCSGVGVVGAGAGSRADAGLSAGRGVGVRAGAREDPAASLLTSSKVELLMARAQEIAAGPIDTALVGGPDDLLHEKFYMNDASLPACFVTARPMHDLNYLDEKGYTSCDLAAHQGNYLFVWSILNCGCNLPLSNNRISQSLLACCRGAGHCIDDNAQLLAFMQLPGERGQRPPHFPTVAHLLVAAGADVNAQDNNGSSALGLACIVDPRIYETNTRHKHSLSLVKYLLSAGASADGACCDPASGYASFLQDHHNGALGSATYYRQEAVMRLLLEHGASPHISDRYGTTVFRTACEEGWNTSQAVRNTCC